MINKVVKHNLLIVNKKGVAFLTTVILLGIIVIATAALSFMLLNDVFTLKRLKASTQAYCLAEAGIEEAIERLWTNNFDMSSFPIMRNLGAGSITVTLNTSKWSAGNILLINSTATVGNISRIIKTSVKANIPPSFNYAVLSNGKTLVSQKSTVNCNDAVGIHSNSPATGGFFTTSAVDVVGLFFPCWVYGNASAVGVARERLQGTITGSDLDNQPAVSLPSFDANFFSYYWNLANESGDVYTPASGTQSFTINLAPAKGVIYVNGNVSLEGNITINGCIIATGDIWVNFITRGTVIQNQVGNLPALMSRGGGIWIWDPTTLNGLVYATGGITIFSLFGQIGDIYINGTIMSKGNVTLMDMTELNYVKQNPPGLSANPVGWVLNWDE